MNSLTRIMLIVQFAFCVTVTAQPCDDSTRIPLTFTECGIKQMARDAEELDELRVIDSAKTARIINLQIQLSQHESTLDELTRRCVEDGRVMAAQLDREQSDAAKFKRQRNGAFFVLLLLLIVSVI